MPKHVESDTRTRLRAKLEAKRIARAGLNNAYEKLDEWKTLRQKFRKQDKDTTGLDSKIETLEEELDRIAEVTANMQYGAPVDGAVGFGCGGGSGCDQG